MSVDGFVKSLLLSIIRSQKQEIEVGVYRAFFTYPFHDAFSLVCKFKMLSESETTSNV